MVESVWNDGFVATVTIYNTGTIATNTWTVAWIWSGNQSIVNSWNATVLRDGPLVIALDMTYNNAIPVSGRSYFGFQVAFSGANPLPTLSCSAT